MTGTSAACLHTNQSRSYLNHTVYTHIWRERETDIETAYEYMANNALVYNNLKTVPKRIVTMEYIKISSAIRNVSKINTILRII